MLSMALGLARLFYDLAKKTLAPKTAPNRGEYSSMELKTFPRGDFHRPETLPWHFVLYFIICLFYKNILSQLIFSKVLSIRWSGPMSMRLRLKNWNNVKGNKVFRWGGAQIFFPHVKKITAIVTVLAGLILFKIKMVIPKFLGNTYFANSKSCRRRNFLPVPLYYLIWLWQRWLEITLGRLEIMNCIYLLLRGLCLGSRTKKRLPQAKKILVSTSITKSLFTTDSQ